MWPLVNAYEGPAGAVRAALTLAGLSQRGGGEANRNGSAADAVPTLKATSM